MMNPFRLSCRDTLTGPVVVLPMGSIRLAGQILPYRAAEDRGVPRRLRGYLLQHAVFLALASRTRRAATGRPLLQLLSCDDCIPSLTPMRPLPRCTRMHERLAADVGGPRQGYLGMPGASIGTRARVEWQADHECLGAFLTHSGSRSASAAAALSAVVPGEYIVTTGNGRRGALACEYTPWYTY